MKYRNFKTLYRYSLAAIASLSLLMQGGCADKSAQSAAPVKQEEDDIPVINLDKPAAESDTAEGTSENAADSTPKADPREYILSEDELSDNRIKAISTNEAFKATLLFAGDINFDDGYANMGNYHRQGGIDGVLSKNLMQELNSADIFMINNEFPYSNRGTPTAGKKFTFRAKPEYVQNLKKMGADIVSLANNHAYDHGPDALMDTFDTLEGAEIPYVGAGRNIEEATKPFYFIAGDMKIAYVSATQIERGDSPDTKEATLDSPGVLRTLDPTKFLSVIKEADSNADFTVVYVHWGSENTYDVDESQKSLAKKYAEAGADLIIGDHSHCLQGFEYINNVPVIYSLGNFWFSSKNIDSCVVKITLVNNTDENHRDAAVSSVKFIPCVQHDCRTDMYQKGDSEYSRILGAMTKISYDVSIDEDGIVTPGAGHGVEPVEPKPLKKADYQLPAQDAVPEAIIQPEATPPSDAAAADM